MVTELMSDPLWSFTGFNCNLVSFLFEKCLKCFKIILLVRILEYLFDFINIMQLSRSIVYYIMLFISLEYLITNYFITH